MSEAIQLRCAGDVEIYNFKDLERPFPSHFHETALLGCLRHGHRQLEAQNLQTVIGPGDLVFLPPGAPHSCKPLGGEKVDWICILAPQPPGLSLPVSPCVLPGSPLAGLLQALGEEQEETKLEQKLDALFLAIAASWGREDETADFGYGSWPKPRTLAQMAQEKQVDKIRLLRQFRKSVGITPGRHCSSLRVILAKQRIAGGSSLAEAASGFCDQSHLNRVFKRLTGVTPGQWRQAHVGEGEL